MCLNSIIKKTRTNKMIPVWKIVRKIGTSNNTIYAFGIYYYGNNVEKGINKAHVTKIDSFDDGVEYNSGFFSFLKKEDAVNYYNRIVFGEEFYHILKFYIPKGTYVTIGIDLSRKVIVSPKLLKK